MLEKLLETRRDALARQRRRTAQRPLLPAGARRRARSRVAGIVHDRSGSGQTVFVEPIEVIESNNDLAMAAAEERREIERLLAELRRGDPRSTKSCPTAAVAELASLDALEAAGRVRRDRARARCRRSRTTAAGRSSPRAIPCSTRAFEKLRRRVLGESRDGRTSSRSTSSSRRTSRLLVVSGPNAGGKTVVLKTGGPLRAAGAGGCRSRPPRGRGCRSSGRSAPRSATRRRSSPTARPSPPRWRRSRHPGRRAARARSP